MNSKILIVGNPSHNNLKIEIEGEVPFYKTTQEFITYLKAFQKDKILDSIKANNNPMGPAGFLSTIKDDQGDIHQMLIGFDGVNPVESTQYRDINIFCQEFNKNIHNQKTSVKVTKYCMDLLSHPEIKTIVRAGVIIGTAAIIGASLFSPEAMVKREISLHTGEAEVEIGRTISMRSHAKDCILPEGSSLEERAVNYLVSTGKDKDKAIEFVSRYIEPDAVKNEAPGKTK
ncbi:MAG: hypothetical protein RR406_01985 [Bacilli bacterium]